MQSPYKRPHPPSRETLRSRRGRAIRDEENAGARSDATASPGIACAYGRAAAEGCLAAWAAGVWEDVAGECLGRGAYSPGVAAMHPTSHLQRIAQELGIPLMNMSARWLVSSASEDPEGLLKLAFEEAKLTAPCLLFVDELEAITPKPESRSDTESIPDMSSDKSVIVMSATNRPDLLDPALRRVGRFEHEIRMSVPDDESRQKSVKCGYSLARL
ncbi:hypothetical protein PC9H_009869 [Pleurotus ostreatus]|uniref:ATPase AAA-type core domain-containing protein n=1 Tax=Pleurotus ostreatus TaxID=5322 RepID=A0A8H6ZPV6_PLEOS|nr:uncharacterized protein PC9H_009869 [Pleurotus ostreatus]KAF7424562.1 hypothetical protein PC9H_009869 [Pleurotus ostreatus]